MPRVDVVARKLWQLTWGDRLLLLERPRVVGLDAVERLTECGIRGRNGLSNEWRCERERKRDGETGSDGHVQR